MAELDELDVVESPLVRLIRIAALMAACIALGMVLALSAVLPADPDPDCGRGVGVVESG